MTLNIQIFIVNKNPSLLSIRHHTFRWLLIISTAILLLVSSLRHLLFQSNALDLGWFDQGIFLISQGKTPIISFVGYHILGDHAAFIVYPLSLLYKLYPSVYWLFFVQALALTSSIIPLKKIALQASLSSRKANYLCLIYLLYPLVFNVNLFDFHPEVIAVPLLFWAILAARRRQLFTFSLLVVGILSCKAILALTIVAFGLWLILFEKRPLFGAIGVVSGTAWFIIATKIIIPFFTQHDAAVEMADNRYQYLGDSLGAIISNLFLKPNLLLSHLFTPSNLEYLILLFVPVFWCLNRQSLSCLVPTLPTLFLNLLADYLPQKNLTTQYSLPILPFLCLAMVVTLADPPAWLKNHLKFLLIWAVIGFLALAKYGYFTSLYLQSLDTWSATNAAIAEVKTEGGVLTSANIAPHLTHRPLIKLAINGSDKLDLDQFDYVLINGRHPGWESSPEVLLQLLKRLEKNLDFQLKFQKDDVILLQKSSRLNAKR